MWLSENRAHYTIWTQEHHPAYETTDGSGYTFIDGEESTTVMDLMDYITDTILYQESVVHI